MINYFNFFKRVKTCFKILFPRRGSSYIHIHVSANNLSYILSGNDTGLEVRTNLKPYIMRLIIQQLGEGIDKDQMVLDKALFFAKYEEQMKGL